MQQKELADLILHNSTYFAHQVCQTIADLTGEIFVVKDSCTGDDLTVKLDGFIISIRFSGKIEGAMFLTLDSHEAAKTLAQSVHTDQEPSLEELISFYKETMNISGGKAIEELEKIFNPIIIHPPEVIIGQFFLPQIFSGKVSISGIDQEATCIFSVDMATLNIGIKVNQKAMEEKIRQKTKYLILQQKRIAENARKAGMADIATNILHNVGNVLNSISVSSDIISTKLSSSKLINLSKASKLLEEHSDDISNFLLNTDKGQKLLTYYTMIGQDIEFERNEIFQHSQRLVEKTKMISDIINSQQDLANSHNKNEVINLEEVIDDALCIEEDLVKSTHIEKMYSGHNFIYGQRIKLIHIIINILRNAHEAMDKKSKKTIYINTIQDINSVYASFTDTGEGIEKSLLHKIFRAGYSTKYNRQGMGLHTSANYMTEMNGQIKVKSNLSTDDDFKEEGATFILVFPHNEKVISKGKSQ